MADTIVSKRCLACKTYKLIDEFSLNRTSKDGFQPLCKTCHSAAVLRSQKKPKGRIAHNKANRKYKKTLKGVVSNKKYELSDRGRINRRRISQRHRVKYPEQIKAQTAISHSVASGGILPANFYICEKCLTAPAQQYHHHLGYSKSNWLNVIPVCHKCHLVIHKVNRL